MMEKLTLPGRKKPWLMAHRGNRVLCPENTLAAFEKAILDGADILETDLHLSADGVFMCIHDHTLDRTTNASGDVSAKTLSELKEISAWYGFKGYESERIPTLAELAAILPTDVGVALELKIDDFLDAEICRKLVNELKALKIIDRVIVISFSLARVQALQAIEPSIPIGWITMAQMRARRGPEVLGPFWPALFLNPFFVRIAHRRGQLVCPLDPTPDRRLWFYKWLNCDVVITDNPAATFQEMKRISFK